MRAAIQLRATLAELGMPSISSIFPMPKVQDQFEEDGTPRDPAHERRVARFFDEFEWHAKALKEARKGGGLGLRGMKERIQAIGGTLHIESSPGKGTTVSVLVPPAETSS